MRILDRSGFAGACPRTLGRAVKRSETASLQSRIIHVKGQTPLNNPRLTKKILFRQPKGRRLPAFWYTIPVLHSWKQGNPPGMTTLNPGALCENKKPHMVSHTRPAKQINSISCMLRNVSPYYTKLSSSSNNLKTINWPLHESLLPCEKIHSCK